MTVTEDELKQLLEVIEREGVHVFYVTTAVEFGVLGEPEED